MPFGVLMANRVPERDRPEFKHRLIQNLGKGKSQAIPGPILALKCEDNVSSDRMTRMMIGELRADGIPVASSTGKPSGFFIAETREEVDAYI